MVKYDDRIDNTFTALAHPMRRSMLERLKRSGASVGELAEPFDVSLPAITKHLKVLERAGLITRKRDGQVHRIQLEASAMRDAAGWLEQYRTFWGGQLDKLEKFIFQEQLDEQ